MIRGTTATLICTLPFEVNTLQYAYFTIMQDNIIVFDKQIECSHLSGDTIEVHLSQEDTLKLKENIGLRFSQVCDYCWWRSDCI